MFELTPDKLLHLVSDTDIPPFDCGAADLNGTAPFYAVKLWPGDIGSSVGLVTDAAARVLGEAGPIAGLWAGGNDMASIMGGTYPGPGITIGPAIAFAHVAARDAAGNGALEASDAA